MLPCVGSQHTYFRLRLFQETQSEKVLLPAVNIALSPLWPKVSHTSSDLTNKGRREKIFFLCVYFVLFTGLTAVNVIVSPLLSSNFPFCPRGSFPQQRREKQVQKLGKHYCKTKERVSLPMLRAGGRSLLVFTHEAEMKVIRPL